KMSKRLDIKIGDVFHKLKVLSEGEKIITPSGQTNRTLKCICECGNVKDIRVSHLIRGRIKSCGCIKNTLSGKSTTQIGRLYRGIKSRCSDYHSERHLYFYKGIKMCEEWDN